MFKIINYKIDSKEDLIIAHFSDIHFAKKFNYKKLDIILEKMNELKPNYICITGDIVDDPKVTKTKELNNLIEFLEKLSKISKVIVGLGNHDTYENSKWYLCLKDKVILLDNDSYEDKSTYFYGLTMNNKYYKHEDKNVYTLSKKVKELKLTNKYNILLVHSPINFDKEDIKKINKFDLVLTGHTHNGIMPHFVPGNRGLIAPNKKILPNNVRNSFESGKSKVIISGGITKLSLKSGIFHLFNPFFASDLNYIYLKNVKKSQKNKL